MKTKQICLLLFFFFMLLWNCTENPFGDETKISGNSISGKVIFNDHSNAENVHVWLKALDKTARSDANGFFSIPLPSPGNQPGGGLNGLHDLYFYVANYQFESIQILIINGKISSSGRYLDENGELISPIVLSEILNISTSFTRNISENNEETVFAHFSVKTLWKPVTVSVDFSYGEPEIMTGYLLDSDKQYIKFLKPENRSYRTNMFKIGITPVRLSPVITTIVPGELAAGVYEVVPHLVILQENLPEGLMDSISEDARKFGLDFLKIPMKIESNRFEQHNP